jgi:hypothetical protein
MTVDAARRRWLFAAIGAVLVHAIALLGARFELPGEAAAVEPMPPLQLVFTRPAESALSQYVEQPESGESVEPTAPESLSNVDALAADPEAGAGETQPRQSGDAEQPSVAMQAGPSGERPTLRSTGDAVGELVRAQPDASPQSEAQRAPIAGSGEQMFEQPDAERMGSGVELFGDVRLSTVAWEFAPWLQRFRAALLRNWQAPYAFHLGLIHGQQRIRVEVGRDGALLALTLLSNEGHESLQSASLAAFRAAAPYAPLPDHFPDERLVMHWTLIYPNAKR